MASQLDFPVPKLNLLENLELHTLPSMEELKDVVFFMSPEVRLDPMALVQAFIKAAG